MRPLNLIFLLLALTLKAQNDLKVISCSGGYLSGNGIYTDFVIGEVSTSFISSYGNILSEGFLQPFRKSNNQVIPKPVIIDDALKVFEFVSPNNDGKNETLYIRGLSQYPDNELIIFDKEGTLVYKMKSYDNSWDGGSLPSDNYFYIFTANKNLELKGGLVLTR